ncbi:hypothetical protein BpHYR1_010848 [Brachionus plicatilis]|uniref:Uncharacterized protein n=1 Tax=Brachionus plicatilis TaxID=10195 RepID=A0A3M7RVY1_BRAPC|nr:hypothetical protein BpHYR1_010848 [Brachionus plicatilis]
MNWLVSGWLEEWGGVDRDLVGRRSADHSNRVRQGPLTIYLSSKLLLQTQCCCCFYLARKGKYFSKIDKIIPLD